MVWNWQKKDWPSFRYNKLAVEVLEAQFLRTSGIFIGTYQHINDKDRDFLIVELMSNEALKTSKIEGEILNHDSLQSSIRRNLGLDTDNKKIPPAEQGIAEMMVDLYRNFKEPLTQKCLFSWHEMLMKGRRDLNSMGAYRTDEEIMQVVSGPLHRQKIHFEAPASSNVRHQMKQFIVWFNESAPNGAKPLPALTRAGLAHLYFVSIHPFEDGNGRIARAISEKGLSQSLQQPTLISLSHLIEKYRKAYYKALEDNNKAMEITDWLLYFAKTIIEAQAYTQNMIDFLIEKTKIYDRSKDKLNERQKRVIERMFHEGPEGFKGGLSAENYITITGTSRATATRDLQDLVNLKVLNKVGELKSTRYYLNMN
jgi:Fic family protein